MFCFLVSASSQGFREHDDCILTVFCPTWFVCSQGMPDGIGDLNAAIRVGEGRSGGSGLCGLRDAWTGGLGQLQLVFCCSVSNYTVLIESSLRDWKEQRKLRRSEGRLTVHLAGMVCG